MKGEIQEAASGSKSDRRKRAFRRSARTIGCFAAFFFSLAGVCIGIHELLPSIPEVPVVHAKMAYFREHADEFDTIFIGTSRIFHQIIPQQFDKLAAEKGMPVHSYNFGVDGMRPPEDAYVWDAIMETHPRNLKWVFVELNSLRTEVDPAKRGTIRLVYWHDLKRMLWVARDTFRIRKARRLKGKYREVSKRLPEFFEHCGIFIQNMSNVGRADYYFSHLYHPEKSWALWSIPAWARDGFMEVIDRKEMLEPALTAYRKAIAKNGKVAREDYYSSLDQRYIADLLRKIRAAGATPILIVAPTTANRVFVPDPSWRDADRRQADSAPDLAPVLNFSNGIKYPSLYEEHNRLDTDHLSTPGAQEFTRILVDEFPAAATAGKGNSNR